MATTSSWGWKPARFRRPALNDGGGHGRRDGLALPDIKPSQDQNGEQEIDGRPCEDNGGALTDRLFVERNALFSLRQVTLAAPRT